MGLINLNNVSKNYKSNCALNNVNIEFEPGQITAIIGQNGAGKTTLLKSILGLINYDGKITINNEEINILNQHKINGKVFFVPEAKGLQDYLTVNTLIKELKYHSSSLYDFKKLERLITVFRLEKQLGKKIRELSFGMNTTLYMILALSNYADIILLDEPFSGLDPFIRYNMIDMIKEESINLNRTFIYSSHILEEVETLSDNILILHKGNNIYYGTIDNAKEQFCEIICDDANDYSKYPGVLFIKEKNGQKNLFVKNIDYKDDIKGKKYNLNLKDIYLYLIEVDEGNSNA